MWFTPLYQICCPLLLVTYLGSKDIDKLQGAGGGESERKQHQTLKISCYTTLDYLVLYHLGQKQYEAGGVLHRANRQPEQRFFKRESPKRRE